MTEEKSPEENPQAHEPKPPATDEVKESITSTDQNSPPPTPPNEISAIPSPEPVSPATHEEPDDSIPIQCLQYFPIGKYFLVLAKKQPGGLSPGVTPTIPLKPPEDFRIKLKPETPDKHIFVVNGSNEEMTKNVVTLLKSFGLEPFLSRDPFNAAKSMEEKLNKPAKFDFSIVILSADDFSYPKNGKPGESKLRPAQNVVFEMGYLLGKFKRQNVFVLYYEQKSFLLPTGLNDVMYTPYDKPGHWRKDLIARLKLCGYPIEREG